MPSQIDVMNRALSRVGAKRINSLIEDTAEARAVTHAWDPVRQEVLRNHGWNSVSRRASLPALATPPEFGYEFQYALPAGCLRVVEIFDPGTGETTHSPWVVESGNILIDLGAPLEMRYVFDSGDPASWDPMLVSCVAARLAAEIAEQIGNRDGQAKMFSLYSALLKQAKVADGLEQSQSVTQEDDWINVRY